MYIVLALVAMVGFAVTAVLYKLAAPHIDAVSLTLVMSLVATLTVVPLWLFQERLITPKGIAFGTAAGLIAGVSMVAYITAIHLGKVSVAATLRNLSFLVAILLAVFFLSEKITPLQWMGVGLATVAVLLLSV